MTDPSQWGKKLPSMLNKNEVNILPQLRASLDWVLAHPIYKKRCLAERLLLCVCSFVGH